MKKVREAISVDSESGTPMFSTEAYYQAPITDNYDDYMYKEGVGLVREHPLVIPPVIPMRSFALKLIEAKDEAEIDAVADEYQVPRRYDIPRGEELLSEAKMASALMQMYAVCLPIARGESNKSDTANIFDLLYYARKSHYEMLDLMLARYENYNEASDPETREIIIENCMYCIPALPLIRHFDDFDRDCGCKLQKHYGYDFKKMRRRGNQSPPQAKYHYWDNPVGSQVARKQLWRFTSFCRAEEDQYILNWDACGLAKRYLEILDKHIAGKIKNVSIQLDSSIGVAKLIVDNLPSALYLWTLTQVQSKSEYRVCKMCGRLFAVGAQSKKIYCNLHKKHEIAYYNKITQKVRTETEEGANFKVVYRRNNSEVEHESEGNEEAVECC